MLEALGFWSRIIDAIGNFGGRPMDLFAPFSQTHPWYSA